MIHQLFLLSPANCGGARARMLMAERASFPLASRLHSQSGAPIGDLFSFLSGLYFRGKLAYARAFARPPDPSCPILAGGVLVITPSAGLRGADTLVTLKALQGFARIDVSSDNPMYRRPLEASARAVAAEAGSDCRVILLGSIASPKYVDALAEIFGPRLQFPGEFVGRGDMSRGGLMLRRAAEGRELEYVPVIGAFRRGPRPPRLDPLGRKA